VTFVSAPSARRAGHVLTAFAFVLLPPISKLVDRSVPIHLRVRKAGEIQEQPHRYRPKKCKARTGSTQIPPKYCMARLEAQVRES
jgi:hypothetical protein